MNRSILLSACGMLGLVLVAGSSSTTGPPAEKRAQGKDVLGVWTLIHSEVEGDGTGSLRNPGGRFSAPGGALPPFIWKISKEEIQSGWENLNFPRYRYHYELDRGGKLGTIDLATLTGAIVQTLGYEHAGVFSNDDKLAERLVFAHAYDPWSKGEPPKYVK